MNVPFDYDILDRMEHLIAALRKHKAEINEALAYTGFSYSFHHVVLRVMTGDLDCFVFPNSVIMAEVVEAPNFKSYGIYIAAGDLQEILDAEDLMLAEARLRGCRYLSMTGRRGWEKPLKQMGWQHSLSILKKDVPDVEN